MSTSTSSSMAKSEMRLIDKKIAEIDNKIAELKEEKQILLAQKESLKDHFLAEESKKKASQDWSGTNFPWSKNLQSVLSSKFRIKELRSLQLEAINATMSKEDLILIMPTGGGKSLCYQLPAYLSDGLTLVISPLVALMEDQVRNLSQLGLEAVMLSANSSKQENDKAKDALQNPSSKIRLLYVTPERLAKSKRFMNQLQKCAAQGKFARLAIDEVHCCSTWGHDFRTDYNYLGVLKDMFPNVPIIGLTATSTAKVTVDVQKMLNIEGCLVLRAPFNRPNLFYSVLQKPDSLSECAELLAGWLQGRFKGQTGIIYTTTIKDCETLATELKQKGIKIGVYHAMLDHDLRSSMYDRWRSGAIQVVVATIAFGLGIDKADVRFVIHHALSKSMEMLYQESGRAGRDGKPAECIVLYRLADLFKLSTMVFTQRTGLENLYGIATYCLDGAKCRRSILTSYFDEVWDSAQCRGMCDHCCDEVKAREVEVSGHCRSMYKLLEHASQQDRQLTAIKLTDAWLGTGETKLRLKDIKPPAMERTAAEAVIALLLAKGYLKEDFHYTAYSTISYLKKGQKSSLLTDPSHCIKLTIPKLATRLINPESKGGGGSPTKAHTERSEMKTSEKKEKKKVVRTVISVSDDSDTDVQVVKKVKR